MGNVGVDSPYGKVVIVTGASSGIGKITAEYLAQKGYKVYGTSRTGNNTNLDNEAGTLTKSCKSDNVSLPLSQVSAHLNWVKLDVCCDESVKSAVDYVIQKEGRIDILINNAGFGIAGSVEDTTTNEVISQFNTNFFGVHRMCRAVMPVMRKHGKGLIINISSVAAFFTIPYQSMYSATKAAMEVMSEAIRMEAEPFGVKVALVEPGDTKTGFTDSRQTAREAMSETSVYMHRFKKGLDVMIHDEVNGVDPLVVAKAITKLTFKKNPPVRVIVGAKYRVIALAKRLLPARLVLFALSKIY